MFKELVHLFVESFEQAFAQDESVIIHNEQVNDRLVVVIDKYERVGLGNIEAVECSGFVHLAQNAAELFFEYFLIMYPFPLYNMYAREFLVVIVHNGDVAVLAVYLDDFRLWMLRLLLSLLQ